MRPIELTLKNFGSYEKATIRLKDMPLVGIVGKIDDDPSDSIGSGKSNIPRAILYALYGRFGTKGDVDNDAFLRIGSTGGMCVTYVFMKDGHRYTVTRAWNGTKTTVIVSKENEVVAEGARVADPYLVGVMGLDYDTYLATAYFAQGQADLFTAARPSVRKEYLRSILGLDLFEKARLEAKRLLVEAGQRLGSNQAKMGLEESLLLVDRKSYENDMAGREKSITTLKRELSLLRDAEKAWNEFKVTMEKRAGLQRQVASEDSKADLIQQQLQTFTANVARDEARVVSLPKELEGLRFGRVDEERITTLYEYLARTENEDGEVIGETTPEIESLRKEAEALKETIVAAVSECRLLSAQLKEFEERAVKTEDGVTCPVCANTMTENAAEDHKLELRLALQKVEQERDRLLSGAERVNQKIGYLEEGQKRIAEEGRKKVSSELSGLEEARRENERVKARRDSIRRDIEALEPRIKTGKEQVAKLEQALLQQESVVEEMRSKLNALSGIETVKDPSQHIHDTEEKIREEERTLASLVERLKQDDERRKRVKTMKAEMAGDVEESQYAEALVGAFGKDGVSLLIIENSLPEIAKQANEVLMELGAGLSIQFRTVSETKDGQKKDSLDIIVNTPVGEQVYETFSGGERTMLNFSIRFALSWFLATRAGTTIESVVLDEVFAELDARHREAMVRMLNILKNRFASIIVISHEEIKDAFPHLIVVHKKDRVSRIEEVA